MLELDMQGCVLRLTSRSPYLESISLMTKFFLSNMNLWIISVIHVVFRLPTNFETVAPPEKEVPTVMQESAVTKSSEAEANCGSWMTVKRRQRKPIKAQASPTIPNVIQGSRFQALGEQKLQVNPAVSIPVTNSSKSPDEDPDSFIMDVAFKDLLEQALKSNSDNGKASGKTKSPKSNPKPLADVTNIIGKKKDSNPKKCADKDVVNSAELVTVPVMFGNPVFQSTMTKQTAKAKCKSKLTSSPPSGKSATSAKITKFGPRVPDRNSSLVIKPSVLKEPRSDSGLSDGRPPVATDCGFRFILHFTPMIKVLSWNCRGAGHRDFVPALRLLIQKFVPSVLVLVEPRIGGTRALDVIMSIGFHSSLVVDVIGFSGGIWVL
ncbi:hypothetical protein LINPERPRIM_LOCUS4250 [Linum perenne]